MVTEELRSRLRQKMERRRKRMKAVIRKRRELANADLKALILAARNRRRAVRIWERDEKKFEKEREMAKQAQAAKEQEGMGTENKDEKDSADAHGKAQRRVSFSDTIRIKYIPSLREIKAAQALRRKKKRRAKSKRLLRNSDTKWKRPEIDTTASSADVENSKLSAWFSSVTDSASAARAQSSEASQCARRRSPRLRSEGSLTISKSKSAESYEHDGPASSTTDNSHLATEDVSSSPSIGPTASDQEGASKVKSAVAIAATEDSRPTRGNVCSSLSSDQTESEQKDPSATTRARSLTDARPESATETVSPSPSRSSPKRRKKKVPSSPMTSSTVSSATSLPNPQENTVKPVKSRSPAVCPGSAPAPEVHNQSSLSPKETVRKSTESSPTLPTADEEGHSVPLSSSPEQATAENKPPSEAVGTTPGVNGADAEIEEIFAGMKRKRNDNQVEAWSKKTKFQNEDNKPEARHSSWDKGARYSSDGLRIYTYDELARDQPEGLNGPCPFDCSCCF